MNNKTPTSARGIALSLLVKAQSSKQFSNIALDKALESSSLSDQDKRLVCTLFYGVIERQITLDYRISKLSSRPLRDIDTTVLCLLRIGLYQLMYLDRVPDHAAINETVSLATKRTAGFINGILRSHTRAKDIEFPDKEKFPLEYLSIYYSVCTQLCQRLLDIYGYERTESILSAISIPPATTLRVNTLHTTREDLAAQIPDAAYTRFSPNGIIVKGAVRELYGFDKGLFFVQDEASQICTEVLGAKSGDIVMDICACPGSKSFGAAIDMKNEGKLFAFDLHESKLSLISSSAKRLGIDIIKVARQDGRQPIDEYFNMADKVLCDVPCSGFGVLAKKPELRYKDPSESAALPKIQADILENACKYVKDGGTLVYSTCTILPEENELNIKAFIEKHPEFRLCPFSVGKINAENGYVTLMPDTHSTDGFFIAKLIRS